MLYVYIDTMHGMIPYLYQLQSISCRIASDVKQLPAPVEPAEADHSSGPATWDDFRSFDHRPSTDKIRRIPWLHSWKKRKIT